MKGCLVDVSVVNNSESKYICIMWNFLLQSPEITESKYLSEDKWTVWITCTVWPVFHININHISCICRVGKLSLLYLNSKKKNILLYFGMFYIWLFLICPSTFESNDYIPHSQKYKTLLKHGSCPLWMQIYHRYYFNGMLSLLCSYTMLSGFHSNRKFNIL